MTVSLTDSELDWLIDEILSHKKIHTQEFLKRHNCHYSFSKEILKQKLHEEFEKESFDANELIVLLDNIEEYGNQHIYPYQCNPAYLAVLKGKDFIFNKLEEEGISDVYNNSKIAILPDKPTLTSVIQTDELLKFKWVVKREKLTFLRSGEIKESDNDVIVKYYKKEFHRGIRIFRVNLVSGHAELMIQKLPSGHKYREVQEIYQEKIKNFIDFSHFTPINIQKGIESLYESDEIRIRGNHNRLGGGTKIALTSKDRKSDLREEPVLSEFNSIVGDDLHGSYGNYYWQQNDILQSNIRTTLYGKDNRIGIHGECCEDEVKYVLSTIRSYSQ